MWLRQYLRSAKSIKIKKVRLNASIIPKKQARLANTKSINYCNPINLTEFNNTYHLKYSPVK
ncbi:hypothetical protein PALI_a2893 [Pseudoalteromonas aliena SW19]|uniref:Uncharacterized protein n=1 Tax=Pseudoalteromonas aliena SW19 TaxID=1314866 RepID=A0ABR9E4J4_9GAMM|nr:hypothetical protein [Pseudoalteromonas aliena SW19]